MARVGRVENWFSGGDRIPGSGVNSVWIVRQMAWVERIEAMEKTKYGGMPAVVQVVCGFGRIPCLWTNRFGRIQSDQYGH